MGGIKCTTVLRKHPQNKSGTKFKRRTLHDVDSKNIHIQWCMTYNSKIGCTCHEQRGRVNTEGYK